jgi:hypothetical protein
LSVTAIAWQCIKGGRHDFGFSFRITAGIRRLRFGMLMDLAIGLHSAINVGLRPTRRAITIGP